MDSELGKEFVVAPSSAGSSSIVVDTRSLEAWKALETEVFAHFSNKTEHNL